ncbi:hypothetical protein O181_025837 [Austropuccinia psidii MF-1]|uniref:Uncharacterized protein n=1 Tax=Austropuccinia psidii MF-1 TaxID=1389203 RepID=A0A9Q3CPE0_9BASI|nr:hypothetical protein [Austropuccinia psidii MF-1]
MSVPNSDTQILCSSDSILAPPERPHQHHAGLYQTTDSDDEPLEDYDVGNQDYILAKENGLGMDDVTPPKQSQRSVKRRHICSNIYDYLKCEACNNRSQHIKPQPT